MRGLTVEEYCKDRDSFIELLKKTKFNSTSS